MQIDMFSVFYIIYLLVEVPSNIILKRVGPRFYLPALVVGFGFVSMCTAFVKNFDQLLVARAFLGIFEGGGKRFLFILSHAKLTMRSYAWVCVVSLKLLQTSRTVLPCWNIRLRRLHGRSVRRPSRNWLVARPKMGNFVNTYPHVAKHLLFRRSSDNCYWSDSTVYHALKS